MRNIIILSDYHYTHITTHLYFKIFNKNRIVKICEITKIMKSEEKNIINHNLLLIMHHIILLPSKGNQILFHNNMTLI